MVFRDYTYSVLIVSASEKLNTAFHKLLPVNTYWPVEEVHSVNAARRLLSDRQFDIVLINTPMPDDFGTRLAVDISNSCDGCVLLLAGSDVYDQVCDKVESCGVFTISKPVTERMITQSLHLMCATIERMKRMMAKQATVEEKIEEIRLINHVKWQLIEQKGMTEPEAHKYIEKLAMDQRISKRKAAENILSSFPE